MNMQINIYGKCLRGLLGMLLLVLSGSGAYAQGDLLISPLRLVFEGNKKTQEINLANVGKDTATFAISVVDIRMNEDGSFDQVTDSVPGMRTAGKYIRFFPRRVTLAPNEAQVVKVQLTHTNELTPGEYRSHLYFRAVPDEKPLGDAPSKKDSTAVSVKIVPIFGITSPVIIRVGENDAEAKVDNLSIMQQGNNVPKLFLSLKRTGNMSVYGDLKVEYISPSGKVTQVKLVKGVSVYTPNEVRKINMDLDGDSNVDFSKGKIHVVYTLQTQDKERNPKTAEATLDIQ